MLFRWSSQTPSPTVPRPTVRLHLTQPDSRYLAHVDNMFPPTPIVVQANNPTKVSHLCKLCFVSLMPSPTPGGHSPPLPAVARRRSHAFGPHPQALPGVGGPGSRVEAEGFASTNISASLILWQTTTDVCCT
eukprot:EG_transcript_23386